MKIPKEMIIADWEADHVVIHFRGTHVRELADVEKIMAEILETVENRALRCVVLNFSRVRMLTSSFLGKLVMLHKKLKESNIELRACCAEKPVFEGFRICKLQKLIPISKTEQDALS